MDLVKQQRDDLFLDGLRLKRKTVIVIRQHFSQQMRDRWKVREMYQPIQQFYVFDEELQEEGYLFPDQGGQGLGDIVDTVLVQFA